MTAAEYHRARRAQLLGSGICSSCGGPSDRPSKHYCTTCSDRARAARLLCFFNITADEYDSILASQGGVCAICQHPPKNQRLAVDHDHKTGLVRGLLCLACNKAMGMLRDDSERIRRAADYVDSPPASAALGGPRYGIKGRVTNKAATRRRLNRPSSAKKVA